tara:strand:+ start:52 stop:417 length:366 start_codon:yes stop_codon:yes gene_type:complete
MDSWDIINKLNKEYDELYNEAESFKKESESFKKELKKSKYLNCLRDIEFLYRACLEIEIMWIEDGDDYENRHTRTLQSIFVEGLKENKDDYEHLGHIRNCYIEKTIDELENEYEKLKKELN